MGTDGYLDRPFGRCSNIRLTHFVPKMVNTFGYWSNHTNERSKK